MLHFFQCKKFDFYWAQNMEDMYEDYGMTRKAKF